MGIFNRFFASKVDLCVDIGDGEKPPECLHDDCYPYHVQRQAFTKDECDKSDVFFACKTCGAGRDKDGWLPRAEWCLLPPGLFSDYALSAGAKESQDDIDRLRIETDVVLAQLQDAKAERADIAKHRALSLIDWNKQIDVENARRASSHTDWKNRVALVQIDFTRREQEAVDLLDNYFADTEKARKRLQVMNAKVTNAKKFVKKWILDADAQANKIVAEAEAIAKTRAEVLAGYVHESRRQENLEYEAIHKRNKDQIEQDHAILRGLNKSKADAGAAVVRIVKNGQKLISDAENQAIHIVANGHKVVNAIMAIP